MTENGFSDIVSMAKTIQVIPSPTFGEIKRAEFLAAQFSTHSLQDVQIDSVGNVYARIPGGNALPLVISAHLDSVLTPDEKNPLVQNER